MPCGSSWSANWPEGREDTLPDAAVRKGSVTQMNEILEEQLKRLSLLARRLKPAERDYVPEENVCRGMSPAEEALGNGYQALTSPYVPADAPALGRRAWVKEGPFPDSGQGGYQFGDSGDASRYFYSDDYIGRISDYLEADARRYAAGDLSEERRGM